MASRRGACGVVVVVLVDSPPPISPHRRFFEIVFIFICGLCVAAIDSNRLRDYEEK